MKAPPTKARPVQTPKTATPSPATAAAKSAPKTAPASVPAPRAGGGPTGGRGADVANVRTEGIEFPYPGYLQNVVRQIALQFKPSANSALRAEVSFLIRRDGSISGLRLVTRSGSFSFDQDAMGSVEAASRSFGPLPQGFTDDVLPGIVSFDPRLIRCGSYLPSAARSPPCSWPLRSWRRTPLRAASALASPTIPARSPASSCCR